MFLKRPSACNLNVILTVLNTRVGGESKLETAPKLANRENTEGWTSRLILLWKPGRQTRDDRDGFHKLQFDKKNKNKHNKLIRISDFCIYCI